jgi:hypothetical protein
VSQITDDPLILETGGRRAAQYQIRGFVMSSKPKAAHGDYEYLRAAIEQKEWTENEYGVVAVTTITLRRSPCVLVISIEGREAREGQRDDHICLYQVEWPNAGTYSFPATLFQAFVKVDRMVEEYRNSEDFMLTGYSL